MSQTDSANLILRLYELRRDPTLRAARDWFTGSFHPRTAQEVFAVWMGPESAYYRMSTSYWEMAAALVTHGAIDATMFNDTNTEHNAVYAKMQPFLPELRKRSGLPDYLGHLERVVLTQPNADSRLEVFRRYLTHRATLSGATPTKEIQ
jgi:hypothetical protein